MRMRTALSRRKSAKRESKIKPFWGKMTLTAKVFHLEPNRSHYNVAKLVLLPVLKSLVHNKNNCQDYRVFTLSDKIATYS